MECKCECCPNTISDYCNSGYIQTSQYKQPILQKTDKNGCWTFVCLPVKIPLFFPCFLGAVFNNCLNYTCSTNKNYLF